MTKEQDFNLIKQDLVNEIKGMRKDMDIFMKTVTIHDQVLYGDKVKEPGITEDVRNLKRLAGVVLTSAAGVIGMFGEFVFRTFFHHPRG